jgi:hypothetical protein
VVSKPPPGLRESFLALREQGLGIEAAQAELATSHHCSRGGIGAIRTATSVAIICASNRKSRRLSGAPSWRVPHSRRSGEAPE